MVLRLDSSDCSTTATPPPPPRAMLTATSSLSSSSSSDGECDDALERSERGHSNSMSSYEDDAAMIDAIASELRQEVEEIMQSKFVEGDGKVPRRRSQCEKLNFRRSSGSGAGKKEKKIPSAPATQPAGFGRWSTLVGGDGELPKSIQFYPADSSTSCNTSSPSSSASSVNKTQRSPLLVCGTLALLALTSTVFHQHLQISALQSELEINKQHRSYLERSQSNLLSQLNARDESLDGYKHTHARMARVSTDMGEQLGRVKAQLAESRNEVERLREVERKVGWSERRYERLVEGIAGDSRRAVVEKYGPGPHRVQLQVKLPDSSSIETITVELAPLDKMPHSVHTFLDQVEMGAWDGREFDLHAGHVFMARGPSSSANQQGAAKEETSQVPSLKFPEFDSTYPHDRYTLAFPSPSTTSSGNSNPLEFYVNLQSNTAHHSPRVQSITNSEGEVIEEYVEGESCFGRIADGESRRVVDRMDALGVDGDGRPEGGGVVIATARIVGR